jgi:hypothetical protein
MIASMIAKPTSVIIVLSTMVKIASCRYRNVVADSPRISSGVL